MPFLFLFLMTTTPVNAAFTPAAEECSKLNDASLVSELGVNCTLVAILKTDFNMLFDRICYDNPVNVTCKYYIVGSGQISSHMHFPYGITYLASYVDGLRVSDPVGIIPTASVFNFKYREYDGSQRIVYHTLLSEIPGMPGYDIQLFGMEAGIGQMKDLSIGSFKQNMSSLFDFEIR